MLDQEEVTKSLLKQGYQYLSFLGKGGCSNVLLCYSQKYNQEFAIKRTITHQLSEFEYNNLVSLNHKNIIRLYDSFNDDCSQYLVMDYCPNGTMKQKCDLSYKKFIYYAHQILEAVAYCHSHMIAHRDIKPDNIFLNQYDQVKLADFGIAKKFNINCMSSDKCGTLKYLSPEMLSQSEVDPFKADIWALGITFFYMATGDFPFHSNSREKLELMILKGEINFTKYHHIDQRIKFLIKKMTMKSPQDRPSAEKLLELSMFQNKMNPLSEKLIGRQAFSYHQIQMNLHYSNKLDPFNNDEKIKNNQAPELHSYHKINRFPNLRRLNTHFPTNTF